MPNDSSTNDPKTIWQNQPTEPSKMTLVMIRHKTQQLQEKTRRELLGGIVAAVFMVGCYGFCIWWIHAGVFRMAFALAIAWTLAGQYYVNRRNHSDAAQMDASLSTSLEFYRQEVERRRYLSGRFLLWSIGPIILALGAFCAHLLAWAHGFLLGTVPFFTVLGLWFVLLFLQRMRQQRDLQRELDQLNELERLNNS
jgi:Flp pilus assembly protein TadB